MIIDFQPPTALYKRLLTNTLWWSRPSCAYEFFTGVPAF